LGQKGYTVLKKDLNEEQLFVLRQELMARPYTPGISGAQTQNVTFPIYRESKQKMYMPRFYGEHHFGNPKEQRISNGEDIDVPFAGELRANQKPVVETYLNHVGLKNTDGNVDESKRPKSVTGGGLLELPCAYGKTTISLYLCSKIRKKTLVIVHKEFLMNQWIERIQQFLPTARVGRIQGPIVDIEDKDIVLGMLQSLSMKDYPESTFKSFGLTIIDEVHHISSEVFSCALFKIVTPCMLGLSATMNRKDGTTKVFKMFLGDVVYKGKRDEEHNVVVRALEYYTNDDDFNEVKLDYRGNVQYSTMISKLCSFNPRTEFILRLIKDMFAENAEQQIMVLAHNKNVLKYLHDAIEKRKIAEGSVGYYVGGMKEAALKETEGKKIVIATYSMAAEALDIKSLTTLIMATPKTDIEQAVGRILRQKHGSPIVVDIIDSHAPFQNQWQKRKRFYKKQNYQIVQTDSDSYKEKNGDQKVWRTVFSANTFAKQSDDADCTNISNTTITVNTNKFNSDSLLQGKCLIKMKK
jgi:superfamily II DNA or RNA helicase